MKRIIPLLLVLLPLLVLAQTPTSVNADCGDIYVLTAEPQTGYHFVRWSDDPSIPAQREVTASENITYTAIFELDCQSFSGKCGDNLTWALTCDGVLTISGTGAMTDWNATSHAPWNDYRATIVSVVINDGVTTIGDMAFTYCESMTEVSIPATITTIGDYAFYDCNSLATITIPASVSSIGTMALSLCNPGFLWGGETGKGDTWDAPARRGAESPDNVCRNLTSLTCEAVNPPACLEDVFFMVDKNTPLYVPAGSIEAYKAADQWKDFLNIQAIPGTGFTIVWKNADGEVMETDTNVPEGTMPEYNGVKPSIPSDAQYTYTFAGWTPDVTEVTGNAEYTAVYTKTVRQYTVTWKYTDEFNQNHEDTEEYTYGQVINEPYEPYAHSADGYHYYFTGWLLNGEGETVVFDNTLVADEDKLFIADYEVVRMYLITFYDMDGTTVLQEVWCDENALPAFTNPTPAQDNLVFAGWTPRITVATEDASYTVTYAEAEAASDALQGCFSVSSERKVRFAKGNLQYNLAEERWSLANTQYDIIGLPNINLGSSSFTGTIDMFGFSTTSTNYGVSPSNADADYTGDFRDWGELIGDGWFTLSKDEWNYLYKRQNGNLWSSAIVADRKGIILLPDNWELPEGLEFTPKYRVWDYEIEDFEKNKYTYAEWQRMEAAGAVFLPAAGRRTGGIGNTMNGAVEASFINPATGYYSFMDNTDVYGYYWSCTATSEKNASYLIFNGSSYYGLPAVWSCEKRRGQSVRLVREANYTVTWVNEDGTTLETDTDVPYGARPKYEGETPTKAEDERYTYTFAGWSPEAAPVTCDITYTAVYDAILKECSYETTDGVTIWEDELPYTWESVTFNEAGTETLTLRATDGCDSVVTFTLQVISRNIVLQDNEDDDYYTQFGELYNGRTVTSATLNRQFKNGVWSTLCLPFDVKTGQMTVLGMKGRVYEFKYVEKEENSIHLYFSSAQSIEAGKGYIVNANAKMAAKTSFVFSNVTINTDTDIQSGYDIANLEGYHSQGSVSLVGTLRKGVLKAEEDNGAFYFGLSKNEIYAANPDGTTIRAYRAIFRGTENIMVVRARIVAESEEGVTVSELEVVNGEPEEASETRKFVKDGVLYIERNGVVYDAQGQLVK